MRSFLLADLCVPDIIVDYRDIVYSRCLEFTHFAWLNFMSID